MHRYAVLDVTADGRLVAVRDEFRRYHVLRPGTKTPQIGSWLEGLAPVRGHALLAAVQSGDLYRVCFEHVDLGQDSTLAMMHPDALVTAGPAPHLRARCSDAACQVPAAIL